MSLKAAPRRRPAAPAHKLSEAVLEPLPAQKPHIVNIGLIQTSCSESAADNLKKTLAAAERLAKDGAQIISTQELFRSQYFCQSEDHKYFQLAETIPGTRKRVELKDARIFFPEERWAELNKELRAHWQASA